MIMSRQCGAHLEQGQSSEGLEHLEDVSIVYYREVVLSRVTVLLANLFICYAYL